MNANATAPDVVPFDSWDEGTTRMDLAVRKEMKYTFDAADTDKLRQVLLQPVSYTHLTLPTIYSV